MARRDDMFIELLVLAYVWVDLLRLCNVVIIWLGLRNTGYYRVDIREQDIFWALLEALIALSIAGMTESLTASSLNACASFCMNSWYSPLENLEGERDGCGCASRRLISSHLGGNGPFGNTYP